MGFKPSTPLKLMRHSCRRLSELNGVLRAPNRTLLSCAKTEIKKSLFLCLLHVWRGRLRWLPKRIEATNGGHQPTKFEPDLSIGLACIVGYNLFARVCAIAHGSCHVQPIDQTPLHRLSVVPAHRMNSRDPTSRSCSRSENARTDGHAHKHRPDYFFLATLQRKSSNIEAQLVSHWSLFTLRFWTKWRQGQVK